ncbi:hypothetical protein [Amycolatopsis sp. NPDC003861]
MDAAGDPAIAFGPHNTVYYATLVFSRAEVPDDQQLAGGIAVSVSHDGGRSFGDPAILHLDGVTPAGTPTPARIFNDKEWIAADPVSGDVYVTWTQFTYDASGAFVESPIVLSKSRDFQVAYETSVCATAACDRPADHDAVVVATSRDGGRTFRHAEVGLDFDFPVDEDIANNALTGENFRVNSFPQLTYDRVTDHLWVTWADDRNGTYRDGESVKTNGDAFLSGSDGRRGWSKPLKIGSGADEVFPAVAAFGGRVAVTSYTRAYDPNGIGLDYAYAAGWGDGLSPLRRITTQMANPQVQFVPGRVHLRLHGRGGGRGLPAAPGVDGLPRQPGPDAAEPGRRNADPPDVPVAGERGRPQRLGRRPARRTRRAGSRDGAPASRD